MDFAYEEFSNHIIRPARDYYQQSDLGQTKLTISGQQVIRQDIQLLNPYNQKLHCSFFSLVGQTNAPCIVYSHCNSGNRLEGMMYLQKFIENGIQLCCFDFHGCGISDGDFVSLGFYESWDIETVVNYLRGSGRVGKIVLWGRSMGSVATLTYAARDPCISALVLDCPFKSLKKMILELAQKHYSLIPKFLLSYVIRQMEKYIYKTAHFKFSDLEIGKHAQKCQMFGIFITSKEDQIVNHKQVNELFQEYQGRKEIVYTNGGHNNYRNEEFQQKIIYMLKSYAVKDCAFREKFKGFYINSVGNYGNERNYAAYSPQSFYHNQNTFSSPRNSFNQKIAFPMTTANAYFVSSPIKQRNM